MSRPVEFFRHALGEAELESFRQTLSSVFLTLGPRVQEFEAALGEALGLPHVVGVSSCSTGLILALRAFGVGPGDEVITTPMTFVATSNAILHVGATHRFVDVEPRTGLMDVRQVEAAISPRSRAVISVDLYGQQPDHTALRALCDRAGLKLIEDAAHAVETERDGARAGALADAVVFSFYATKNLTSGDGGAVGVHDEGLAKHLRSLRNHGITKDAATRYGQRYSHWDMVELGYKAPMTDIEASLLLPQLPRMAERRDRRQALVERYERLMADIPGVELVPRVGRSAHHLFACLVPAAARDALLAGLGDRRIGCAVNYRSVHTLGYYREHFGYGRDDFPVAADFGERTVSLPLWPDLPLDDVDVVVDAVRAILAEHAERPAP